MKLSKKSKYQAIRKGMIPKVVFIEGKSEKQ
jgi:hypothetical protein